MHQGTPAMRVYIKKGPGPKLIFCFSKLKLKLKIKKSSVRGCEGLACHGFLAVGRRHEALGSEAKDLIAQSRQAAPGSCSDCSPLPSCRTAWSRPDPGRTHRGFASQLKASELKRPTASAWEKPFSSLHRTGNKPALCSGGRHDSVLQGPGLHKHPWRDVIWG